MVQLVCVVVALVAGQPGDSTAGQIDQLIARAESKLGTKQSSTPRFRRNVEGQLVALHVDAVTLTSKDIEAISQCESLELLSLARTNISDDQLKAIAQLQRLRSLSLNDTDVTDAGLDHLLAIKTLRSVCLGGVRVTPGGVQKLRKTRPDLQIGYFPKLRAATD